jgi:N-acetylmuramoyl-L-alanine amidase
MRNSESRSARGRKRLLFTITGLGLALWLWPARSARSDNFVFYLPGSRQLLPVQTVDRTRYLPLLKVLNLIGTVSNVEEKRHNLKVWMSSSDRLELHDGDRKLKLNREDIRLQDPVRLSGAEWMVPLDFLYSVLPRLTNQQLQYRTGDERMFVGDLKPLTFSATVTPVPNGARLTLQFSDPVTTQTASTNGQYVIFLGDRALQPLEAQIQFQNQYVTGVRFDDQDGVPKLIVSPSAPGLNFYPSTSGEGRVFQADFTQPAPVQTAQSAPPASPPGQPVPSPGSASAPAGQGQPNATGAAAGAPAQPAPPAQTAPPPLPVVVLDPGHGGQDSGAHSRDGVSERDLVASLVDLVRAALASTGKFRVVSTRTGSSDPSADERDAMANLARPVAFLTFHAGDLGGSAPAVEVYTYQAPSALAPPVSPRVLFVPWSEAQQAHLVRSHDLASLLAQQFGRVQGLDARNPDEAPERQLRSIDAPAVAVELGSLDPSQDAGALASASLQNQIATAVAQAVTALAQGAS